MGGGRSGCGKYGASSLPNADAYFFSPPPAHPLSVQSLQHKVMHGPQDWPASVRILITNWFPKGRKERVGRRAGNLT
jgi:hypothetical protein